ncbi:glycosyltransferase family 2 protein [Candidatus Microgenomates bacterium]|nr:MAG: glycosyltransferase family 2 protein [Candidatus Microgenomates bacterium]
MKLSVVVNTRNEEAAIERCLSSVSPYVDEIVVVDMESTDETRQRARKYTNKIFKTKPQGYVEPARNFAISKASGEWILLIDADEVLPESLGLKLRKLVTSEFSYYRLARKNLIFGKWMKHTGWWPDYQIRLFDKQCVFWQNEIHSIPITQGRGTDLEAEESLAIIHYNYQTVEQFIERLNRYTSEEAKEAVRQNQTFHWTNLIRKPTNEFFARFFSEEGYKDGVHGLALSLLQAFSMLVVELKIWQYEKKFAEIRPKEFITELNEQYENVRNDYHYWFHTTQGKQSEGLTKNVHKARAKLRL